MDHRGDTKNSKDVLVLFLLLAIGGRTAMTAGSLALRYQGIVLAHWEITPAMNAGRGNRDRNATLREGVLST